MNKIAKNTFLFKRTKILTLLLGLLLLISGQLKAQLPTDGVVHKEDFGGNNPASSAGSGDWWIMLAGLDADLMGDGEFSYYDYEYDYLSFYGQNRYRLWNDDDKGRFFITKLISSSMYDAIDEVKSDHTLPDDETRGYFAYLYDNGNTKTVYTHDIDVTDEMRGLSFDFDAYIARINVWGNGNSLTLEVKDGNSTIKQEVFPLAGREKAADDCVVNCVVVWEKLSTRFAIPAEYSGSNITISITLNAGGGCRLGLDDISVKIVEPSILITSPTSTTIQAKVGDNVPLEAKYYYGSRADDVPNYRWEKSDNGTTWSAASATTTGSPSFTTAPFSATETSEKYVYYRLAVSYDDFDTSGTDTYYSDIIIVDFQSDKYIFKYDFGGNWVSGRNTDALGATGDWWIMPGNEPTMTTDFSYSNLDGNAERVARVAPVYGQQPIDVGPHRYGITKLSGAESGAPEGEWGWSNKDDHTFPNDDARGYFAYFFAQNAASDGTPVVVYSADIPVTTGAMGEFFSFNASFLNLHGDPEFTLKVESSDFNYSTNITISGSSWNEYSVPFAVPANYSGTVKISIILKYGDRRFGLDDISVTKYDTGAQPETFGGCGTSEPYVSPNNNTYKIPGFSYFSSMNDGKPDVQKGQYIITSEVYQGTGSYPFNSITDHTGCGGYFLQVNSRGALINSANPAPFYTGAIADLCGGAEISFHAWIANITKPIYNIKLKFKFRVEFNDANKTNLNYITPSYIEGATVPAWNEYGSTFTVPAGATAAFVYIESYIDGGTTWNDDAVFVLDDILIKKVNPVQITTPATSVINVPKGATSALEGEYNEGNDCNPLTGNIFYQWQESIDGVNWTDVSGATEQTYTPAAINTTTYYRLVAIRGSESRASEPVSIVPFTLNEKTYWMCPDNMTDRESLVPRKFDNKLLPGMVSWDEPGYLPSLIYMEVDLLEGITYKWYEADGTTEIPNLDDYDPDQKDLPEPEDPIILPDGKSNTISVYNERNTSGIFKDRTYWVEICDTDGVPFANTDKVPIYLKQAYICASTDAVVSAVNANRMHRTDFGGTDPNDPNISTTPLTGIDYQQSTSPDYVGEGDYQVSKLSPIHSGWHNPAIQDHIYENIANEKHGYMLSVNATPESGLFYTYQISDWGLCRDIELIFSGWFTSAVGYDGMTKANLKFVLINTTTGEVLSEFATGNLLDISPVWKQYGFRFYVPEGVTELTLKLVNNNFGTSGGNDVFIDDIEIYLAIPPVTLVPSIDSYVCPDNTRVSLKGSYQDDGTLGNELDFHWEYRATETDAWTILSGSEHYGEVKNGVVTPTISEYIIPEFQGNNDGFYRLVVGQTGAFSGAINYDCVGTSERRFIQLAEGENSKTPAPSLSGLTAICYDESITITNEDIGGVGSYKNFTWLLDGKVMSESDVTYNNSTNLSITLNPEDLTPGYHTVTLSAYNVGDCSAYAVHEFLVYPEVTTWTAQGTTNNWNDYLNWDNGVPGDCTDAIIPNKAMAGTTGVELLEHYPLLITPIVETLNDNYNSGGSYTQDQLNLNSQRAGKNDDVFSLRPACDTISFRMGGAVARTDYLKYNFAQVDLDVQPNRWYIVSAPLRAMYSGDYFVIGNVKRQNPTVYMMKYNATNPQTNDVPAKQAGDFSNPFNTLSEDLHPGLGYAVFVDDGNKVTPELQPFRFPKDSTEYAMWNYHGDYFGQSATLDRSNIGRFTYEKVFTGTLPATGTTASFDVTVEEDKDTYSTILIGNPFMSHLSFTDFANANENNTKLDAEGYYIWTSGDTFDAYMPGTFPDHPNTIAPMQSFIMKKKTPIQQIVNLTFSFDMMIKAPAPTDDGATLRSSVAGTNSALRIDVLRDDVAHSNIRLRYKKDETNKYDAKKDMWTLFSNDFMSPAVVYALLEGKAASVRTLGDLSESIELGIRTDVKGTLTFRLSGMESLDSSYDIYLEDRVTEEVIDMRENPEYTFDNESGNVQGRFFLKIGTDSFDPEDMDSFGSDIRIFANNSQIKATSPVKEPIETVRVYSLQGKLLFEKQNIGQSSFSMDSPVRQQMVIVVVTTSKNRERQKLMIQ